MTLEYLPIIMLRTLSITILIEGLLAWTIGVRNKNNQIVIACANIITNPLVVSLSATIRLLLGSALFYPLTIMMEVLAFYTEGRLYTAYLKTRYNAFFISAVLNLASYSVGELINYCFL